MEHGCILPMCIVDVISVTHLSHTMTTTSQHHKSPGKSHIFSQTSFPLYGKTLDMRQTETNSYKQNLNGPGEYLQEESQSFLRLNDDYYNEASC